nr:uncharacterized protein LOC108005251 [Drosophila suzukii]
MPRYPNPNKKNKRGEVASVREKQVEIPVKDSVDIPSPRSLEDCDGANASSKRASRGQRPSQSKKPKSTLKRPNFKKSEKCVAKKSTILMALQQNENLGDIVSEKSPEPHKSVILRTMVSLGRGVFGFIKKSLYNAEPEPEPEPEPEAENSSEPMPQQSVSQEGETENVEQLPLEEDPPVLMPQQSETQEGTTAKEEPTNLEKV